MALVLVIPDVHLRPAIFDRAEKILLGGKADFAIQLGDLFDDWDEEYNLTLYEYTAQRVIEFHKKFPKTLWCMGNHDLGYYDFNLGRRETGHSRFAEDTMREQIKQMEGAGIRQEVVWMVDNVLFSHAGVTSEYVKSLLPDKVNWSEDDEYVYNLLRDSTPRELWEFSSPIWVRLQGQEKISEDRRLHLWKEDKYLQVVGHTPVRKVIQEGSLVFTDVFSTWSNGAPIGNKKFVIVDTENKTWETVKEEE